MILATAISPCCFSINILFIVWVMTGETPKLKINLKWKIFLSYIFWWSTLYLIQSTSINISKPCTKDLHMMKYWIKEKIIFISILSLLFFHSLSLRLTVHMNPFNLTYPINQPKRPVKNLCIERRQYLFGDFKLFTDISEKFRV